MEVTSQKTFASFAVKQNTSPTTARPAIPENTFPAAFPSQTSIVPLTPSAEVIAEVFPFESTPPLYVVDDVFPEAVHSKLRTEGDIIGFSDSDTETEVASNTESDESMDITDIKANVKFLPATVDGLADRFNQLPKEFTRQGKHENRNELTFLLDELLRQDGINRDEYAQLNNILAESLDDDEEEIESTKDEAKWTTVEDDEDESRGGKLKKLIRPSADYLIEHDKKELIELIKEFRKYARGDFLDDSPRIGGTCWCLSTRWIHIQWISIDINWWT